jgi:NADH dehydrogenase FAD-containing subunit
MPEQLPRVVIVGGGFGDLAAAEALRRTPVDVSLIDRTDHHLYIVKRIASSSRTVRPISASGSWEKGPKRPAATSFERSIPAFFNRAVVYSWR